MTSKEKKMNTPRTPKTAITNSATSGKRSPLSPPESNVDAYIAERTSEISNALNLKLSFMVRVFNDNTVEYRVIDGSPSHFDMLRGLLRSAEKLAGSMEQLATAKLKGSDETQN